MKLCDIGANLTNRSFRHDLGDVLARAREAGVSTIVVTGTHLEASAAALALAEQHAGFLYATAGVHPHHAKDCDAATLAALEQLAAHDAVRAIGECGLDYDRDFSPRPAQREWFGAQLELAARLGMPAFLHERSAHADFVDIVRRYRDRLPAACLHCFTGSSEELTACLELDLHIGVTGWICDERRGLHLREIIGRIPSNRLMIETDAPYLLPRTLSPKPKQRRNEPAYLRAVLDTVAESLGKPPEQVATETTQTALAFFGID